LIGLRQNNAALRLEPDTAGWVAFDRSKLLSSMNATIPWFPRASVPACTSMKLLLLVGCLAWLPMATSGQSNPILRGADPDVLLVDGIFWLYSTGSRGQFHVHSSRDLESWERHGPILDLARIPWVPPGKLPWAPGVIQHEGRFYFYYSCGPKPSAIGVAVAEHPAGPFVDSGRPLLEDEGDPGFEAIDAMVFRDPVSGRVFLYCGGSAGSRLRVFELNADLISFAREIEVKTPRHFTEGAYMHHANGRYYLSYSHGSWRHASYSVHHATSTSPVGPWEYHGPILTSNDTYKGPGHHSFLHVPVKDEWLVFYHRYENETGDGPYRAPRHIAIDRFRYLKDGRIATIVMTP
jgi:beta-xylosidase